MSASASQHPAGQAGVDHGAWYPGLESELPRAYWPLETVFRTDNVASSIAKAQELADYCGLPAHELVAFRVDRLIVHELLVRVTASLAVPDGTDYEDLGNNFRRIAATILEKYLAPRRDELAAVFADARRAAAAVIDRELSMLFAPAVEPAPDGGRARRWRWPLRPARIEQRAPAESLEQRDRRVVSEWAASAQSADNRLEEACLQALNRIGTAIIGRRGRLLGDRDLLTDLALTLVSNDYGSEAVGDALAPFVREAAAREGYRLLTAQKKPVIMNVKGASASGKSSMRPLQRILARKLGFPWEDFALISPDIWRKFLLDYGSLGDAYKYAGTMTGREVEIIDKKLDRHMALKAALDETPHLLIDRFRFDSFVPVSEGRESSKLLTRFGDLVYMFFMITPPEMTVERAWIRGLKVGRYKAVEDLLAHNVEAYTGMPELFFTWALDTGKRVHYEFLDNSVAEGQPPRTAAFGWNGEMTILDPKRMLDIDRFRKINIRAERPEEVYAGQDLAPERNTDFLKRCARLIPVITFADGHTGQPYARLERGRWTWRDEVRFALAGEDADARAAFTAVATDGGSVVTAVKVRSESAADRLHTLGSWGRAEAG